MADIIRVKAKKQFEWDQDNKFISVKVPMPGHTIIKNLQIYLSDLILRITSKQKKSSETLDLLKQVQYLSAENKFTFIDGILHATLKKKNQGQRWDSLVIEDISLAQLKARRKQSETRYEQNIKQAQELKQKLKTEYDRKATQQYMRFQQQQRKKLQKKKQDEKEAALNEVFRNVNEKTGRIEHEQKKWQEKGVKALQQLQRQQQQQYERQRQARRKAQQQKYKQSNSKTKTVNKNNQIFDQEDVVHHEQLRNNIQEEIQQIPIRKEAKVSVKFTQKLYPNVATRDYHYTQPPMPKNSVPLQPNREGDLQSRNPLWLKDRGDGFMKMKNYSAALDAYNEAIKIDPTQRKILMNRSLAHMKLLNFDSALTDCQSILLQMQKQLLSSQQSKSQSLLDLLKIKTRKALCLAHKGNISTSKQLLSQQIESFPQMPEQIRIQIQDCLRKVQKRQQSIKIKFKGDEFVKRNAYAQAIQYYDQAIAIDGNQYALSNKGLCLNKCARFQEAVEVCTGGVRLVEECMTGASAANKANPDFINILLKLLYRKSTAHQSLNQHSESQQALRQALVLCPQDKDIKSALQNLLCQKQEQEFAKLKGEATDALTKQNNPQHALTLYGKCLKLVESADKIQQYLSILQNQCVCYLKLQQYDNIIACSIRILNLVNNYKGKVVEFGGKKVGGLTKEAIDKIVVRTLVRRANAYLKTGQVYNAKSDLEKAAEVDPKDPNVTKQLQKLKQSLGTQ